MKKKKQMKIILAIVAMFAVILGGWLMMKPGGLKAEEKNTPSINSVGTSGDITEKFKADVNKVLRDTAPEPDPYNPNPSVIDNGDGTKTFIAAYNTPGAQVNVTNLQLLTTSGNDIIPAPWTIDGNYFNRGLGFTINLIQEKDGNTIEPGDKIIIPLYIKNENEGGIKLNSPGITTPSISNVGSFSKYIENVGSEITVNQTLPTNLTVSIKSGAGQGRFPIRYDPQTSQFYNLPVTLYFGDDENEWGIIQSTNTNFPTLPYRDNVFPGGYMAVNPLNSTYIGAFYYENPNALQSILKDEQPAKIPDDIIAMQQITITSEGRAFVDDSIERGKEGYMMLRIPDNNGNLLEEMIVNNDKSGGLSISDFFTPVDLSSLDLSGDFESQWGAVKSFMEETQSRNAYGVVKISETINDDNTVTATFIAANKMSTDSEGITLSKTEGYKDYVQVVGEKDASPASFLGEIFNIQYEEPLRSKINNAYRDGVPSVFMNIFYDFTDNTVPYYISNHYRNNLNSNERTINSTTVPAVVGDDGETMVAIEFLNENGEPIKQNYSIVGKPTTQSHPEKAAITPEMLKVSGYALDKNREPILEKDKDGNYLVDFPSLQDKRTVVQFYYKKLPTINLTKTGAGNNALPGVTMSIGAKVNTSEGGKLMSLPALYKEMTGKDLDTKDYPELKTDDDGKIAMLSDDPRIATMWDLQSQESGGNVQMIDQWVFVETQAADNYQPSPFNNFDTDGGQSGIPVDYQNQFVFDITPALEIGEGKSYSVNAKNTLNQFKVQPTAIGPAGVDFSSIIYTIAEESVGNGIDSKNLALGVTGGSETAYSLKQTNIIPGYTVANDTQSFTIAQDPNAVNKFTVTIPSVTDDAFAFYYMDDTGTKQKIASGEPFTFTSSNFLTNPILYVEVTNKAGENSLAVTEEINFNEKGDKPHSLPLKDAGPVFPNHDWAITYINNDPNIKNLALKVKLTEPFKNGNNVLDGILRFKSADGEEKRFNYTEDEETLYDKDKLEGLSTTERVIEFAEGSKTGFFLDGAAINAAYQRGEIPPGTSNYQAELTFTLAADPIPTP